MLDKATNIGSGLNITGSQSGYRAFARHFVPVFRFNRADFSIESEMLMDAAKAGLRVKEVEIGVRYDVDSSTKNPVTHGVSVLWNVITNLEFQRPLFYFTLPGGHNYFNGCSFRFNVFWRLSCKVFSGIASSIAPSAAYSLAPTIISIMLTLTGGFLALTGIILDSMSRMMNQIINTNQEVSIKSIASSDKN